MRKYNPQNLPVASDLLGETAIDAELNIEALVYRQMLATCQAAVNDESVFAVNVRLLKSYLPSHRKIQVEERVEEYMSTVERYQYKYFCGVPLGTPENPINGSPALVQEETVDWHKYLEIILEVYEDSGTTWKHDKWTIDAGKVEEENDSPSPTPIFQTPFKNPNENLSTTETKLEDSKEPEKYARPCSICGHHVGPGTGKFFKIVGQKHGKLVHKGNCHKLAEVKWGKEPNNE